MPVLLLWGEHDRIVPSHVARCLLDALPTARLAVIEACGHAPHEECPDRTLAILEPFLRETVQNLGGATGGPGGSKPGAR
jgi:pimeloyl-ACP methyl ester carboxylesterase